MPFNSYGALLIIKKNKKKTRKIEMSVFCLKKLRYFSDKLQNIFLGSLSNFAC